MENKKILIADRDKYFILKVVDALIYPYKLSVAYSKEEAFERAKKESPDLIIIGFLEPWGESFNLSKELRVDVDTKHIPILVVDVKPEEHFRKGYMKNGDKKIDVDAYLSRPINSNELKEEVDIIIKGTLQKKQLLPEVVEETWFY